MDDTTSPQPRIEDRIPPGGRIVVAVDGGSGMTQELTPIVVGVDGSPASVDALRWANAIASNRTRPIHAVTVAADMPDADACSRAAVEAAFGNRPPANLQRVLHVGRPSELLTDATHDAYLLIIGSRGNSGTMNTLHPTCPVVIMHHIRPAGLDHQRPPTTTDAR